MLSLMRRNIGWGLKIVLGLITLSFVFYFGYTQLTGQPGRDSVAIEVNDEAISISWWNYFYDYEYRQTRENLKEDQEMTDEINQTVKERARKGLVTRKIYLQFAKKLGLDVTDIELADSIVNQENYDPVAYKNYLQFFYDNNAFSYEDLRREDLLIGKYKNWVLQTEKLADDKEDEEETRWTFETTVVSGEENKDLAEKIQKDWGSGKSAASLLKKNDLKPIKIGPIPLKNRFFLFSGDLNLEEYKKVFSLKPGKGLDEPLARGDRFYCIRLTDKKVPKRNLKAREAEWEPRIRLHDIWFDDFVSKIDVQFPLIADLP